MEAALVLSLYFFLVFVFISFSLILFTYGSTVYASKAAVRYAVVHSAATMSPCTAAMITSIATANTWGAPPGGISVTSAWSSANTLGSTVTVTVKLTYATGMAYGYLNNLVTSTTTSGIIVH